MNQEESNFAEFEPIPHCQFGVPCHSSWEGVADCGNPSAYIAKWADGDIMYVCEEHAQLIEESEC